LDVILASGFGNFTYVFVFITDPQVIGLGINHFESILMARE